MQKDTTIKKDATIKKDTTIKKDATIIIGGGIVGVCAAESLASAGREVVLIERGDIGGGTSFGNAGVLSDASVAVGNNPDLWRKLPRILAGRAPECRLSPMFALRQLPWLLAFLRRANAADSARAARALAGLLRISLPLHRELIRKSGAGGLLRESGWIKAFRSERGFRASKSELRLLQQTKTEHEIIGGGELARLEPALNPVFARAFFFPGSASVSDPAMLAAAYCDVFRKAGGEVCRANAVALARENGEWKIHCEAAPPVSARDVVVAAGPWSAQLLKTAGVNIPLAWERGYHRHFALPEGGASLGRPVLDVERGFHLTPMRRGYRLTTGDEFAALDAPLSERQLQSGERSAREMTQMGESLDAQPWLGRRPTLPDSLPAIGEVPGKRGLWLNFGHQHIGLSSAPGSAALLTALMQNTIPAADADPFSPSRF